MMETLKGLEAVREKHRGGVVTIGNFDGLHIGHQKILRAVLKEALRLDVKAVALTFEPHPMKVLAPERGVKLLTPPEEKGRLMRHFGMDAFLEIRFTKDFARLAPDEFIEDVLVGTLGARAVIVGHNYAFGRGKKGTTALLRRRGKRHGFGVKVVRSALINGDVVSSSRIRSLISWGRVCEAASYLGRPYSITGTVVRGAGRGSSVVGFPTANLTTGNEVIPKEGVYAVIVGLEGKLYEGVSNIGKNPTFGPSGLSYEVHILDFAGDITKKGLRVYFIDRIRDERPFPDAEALGRQIAKDIARAREIIGGRSPLKII